MRMTNEQKEDLCTTVKIQCYKENYCCCFFTFDVSDTHTKLNAHSLIFYFIILVPGTLRGPLST